jgi:hypothetical protein
MSESNRNPNVNLGGTAGPGRRRQGHLGYFAQRQSSLEHGTDCRKPFPVMGVDQKRPDYRRLMRTVAYRVKRSGLGGGSSVFSGKTSPRIDGSCYGLYHPPGFPRGVSRSAASPYFERSLKNPW